MLIHYAGMMVIFMFSKSARDIFLAMCLIRSSASLQIGSQTVDQWSWFFIPQEIKLEMPVHASGRVNFNKLNIVKW